MYGDGEGEEAVVVVTEGGEGEVEVFGERVCEEGEEGVEGAVDGLLWGNDGAPYRKSGVNPLTQRRMTYRKDTMCVPARRLHITSLPLPSSSERECPRQRKRGSWPQGPP